MAPSDHFRLVFSGGASIGSHKGRDSHISHMPDWICSQEQTSQPRGKLVLAVEVIKEEGRQGIGRPGSLGYAASES